MASTLAPTIAPDRVMAICFDRDFDLGADSVSARNEDGPIYARRNTNHSTKTAEATENAISESRFDELPDAKSCRVGGVDIDSGASVPKRVVAHSGSSSSNATSRRMSLIR